MDTMQPDSGQATVLVSRRPRPGMAGPFQEQLSRTVMAAMKHAGNQGITVLRPPMPEGDYRLVIRFDNLDHYRAWVDSGEAAECLDQLSHYEARPPNVEIMTGLESWFTVADDPLRPMLPPPRHRMALATWVCVLLVGNAVAYGLGPLLGDTPMLLRSALYSGVTVALLTWVVMPRVTRRLGWWLYGKD